MAISCLGEQGFARYRTEPAKFWHYPQNIEVIILSEELLRLKHLDNSTLDKDERFALIVKWKKDHRELLMEQLGPKCVDVSFLHGIFFAPLFSQATVPELQRLVIIQPLDERLLEAGEK